MYIKILIVQDNGMVQDEYDNYVKNKFVNIKDIIIQVKFFLIIDLYFLYFIYSEVKFSLMIFIVV